MIILQYLLKMSLGVIQPVLPIQLVKAHKFKMGLARKELNVFLGMAKLFSSTEQHRPVLSCQQVIGSAFQLSGQ